MRQLVSYDDIAAASVPAIADPSLNDGPCLPLKKRRKNNHRQGQRWDNHPQSHEADDETPLKKTRKDYGLKEESRQLTHEEVWDDSALIHAWDAAMEEYEVLNGPEKKWKSEPVNKSPLWFNIPPETEPSQSSPGPSFLMPSIFTSEQGEDMEPLDLENSHPANFDTFVPRHDPSLSDAKFDMDKNLGNDATRAWGTIVPPPPAGMSSQGTPNEAFERAMGAWYWAGYWTGVYHSRSETKLETSDEAMVSDIEQEEQEVSSEQVETQ